MKLNEIQQEPQFLTDHEEIREWVQRAAGLSGRSAREDLQIDAKGQVSTGNKMNILIQSLVGSTTLRVKFKYVSGYFHINERVGITSLIGCPDEVGSYFKCDGNLSLTSLEGAPRKVKSFFSLEKCGITSMKGGPDEVGDLYLSSNKLHTFDGPIITVRGDVYLDANEFTSLSGIENAFKLTKGDPSFYFDHNPVSSSIIGAILVEGALSISIVNTSGATNAALTNAVNIVNKYMGRPDDIFECQNELIDAGLEEFAKL